MYNLHSDTYTWLTKPILGFGVGHVVTIFALSHFFYLEEEKSTYITHNKYFGRSAKNFLYMCEMHFMLIKQAKTTKVAN